jgi:hypothetical protein
MRGRKIRPIFYAALLFLAAACGLNPQPEPPFSGGNSNDTNGSSTGSGEMMGTGADVPQQSDAGGILSSKEQDGGAQMPDSSAGRDGFEPGDIVGEGGEGDGEASTDAVTDAPDAPSAD